MEYLLPSCYLLLVVRDRNRLLYPLQTACRKDTTEAAAAILCFDRLRCRLSLATLRASIMCIRGSRSTLHHSAYEMGIVLATKEGQVPPAGIN